MAVQLPELTEKEKTVILAMAREGPKTGYDFTQGIRRTKVNPTMSTATWEEVKKRLGLKGFRLIEERPKEKPEEDRGRPKKPYWLTGLGIIAAIKAGADPRTLKAITRDIGEFDENLATFFDLAAVLGKDMFSTYADRFLDVARPDGSIDIERAGKVSGPPILTDPIVRKGAMSLIAKNPKLRKAMEESIETTYRIYKKGGLEALADIDALTGESHVSTRVSSSRMQRQVETPDSEPESRPNG